VTRPPKLVAVDVDGTMLRSDGLISDRVLSAMGEAVASDIHVVPATGRPVLVASDVVESSGLNQFWVFGNGAITRHIERDELIRGFWMDRSVVEQVIERIRSRFPGARFAVEFESTVAYEAGFEHVVPVAPPIPPSENLAAAIEGIGERIQKVLVFDSSVEIGVLWAEVSASVAGLAAPSLSGLPFIELAPHNVSKATALELLARDLGIPASQVVAIGDNHNDVTMLQWAGTGYAMGNAEASVKQEADAVLPTNDEDGVAVLIESLLSQS